MSMAGDEDEDDTAGEDDEDTDTAGEDDEDTDTAGEDDEDDGVPPTAMGMQVGPGSGVGDLLIFAYWTSQMGRDTLLAITNTDLMNDAAVHIRIMDGVASAEVRDFTICMSAGDVWTAAIMTDGAGMSRLMVGNAGSGTSCTNDAIPADGALLASDFGYLEAYTMNDSMSGGGADSLSGTATIVAPAMGFASSYNATALTGFDATDESAVVNTAVRMALAREGGVDKEVLIGRWTAGSTIVDTRTQFVLTFPGSGQPGAAPSPDRVTAHVFDEDENDNLSPRSLLLDQEVNICTFWNKNDTGNNRVALECNDGTHLLTDAEGGWYRIINNVAGTELDNPGLPPATRFAVVGLQFSFFQGTNGIFDQSYPIQWMAEVGAGAMNAMGQSAPWHYPMGDYDLMMIDPGDNMMGGLPLD